MTPWFSARVQVAFWIVLFGFILYLSTAALGFQLGFYRTLANIICHSVNFYIFYYWIIPRYYEYKRYSHVAIAFIIVLLLLTPIRYQLETLFADLTDRSYQFSTLGKISFIVFTEVSIAAFASLTRLTVSHERTQRKMAAMERSRLEAELRFLKAQMNPHFLFNSINNIYSLVLTKSDQAPEALLKLSALLRYLLYETQSRVPLGKELEAMETYLELFKIRYQHALNVSIKQTGQKDVLIEPLIVLPLFENALKHSGLGVDRDSFVNVKIHSDGRQLVVAIHNSKSRDEQLEKGGIGLANVRKRMDALYQQSYSIALKETDADFSIHIQLPLT